MVVAQIAYNHLNPVAKARCDELIAITLTNSSAGTSNFVTAACWADDFKTALGTGIWHYIDLPISLDGTSTNGVVADSFDVVKAINLCITNLQSTSVAQSNKAVCLRYLIHFVGDIQQPLHCSTGVSAVRTTGDGGGNSFYITSDFWGNLHSLWDAGGSFLFDTVSRPLSVNGQNILNAKVTLVEADYPYNYSTNLGTIPNPMTWAQEGKNLALTSCYAGLTQGGTLPVGYTNAAMATTEQRMAAGGHRLADLLNTLFQPISLGDFTRTNGVFKFSWNSVSNTTYKVQWTTNIVNATWNDLTNITATTKTLTFSEKVAPVQKFYRVLQ